MANTANSFILYSDFRTDFTISPITGDLILVTNENSVKQSIINLCLTSFYEHYWKPQFGAGLAGYLFENPSIITQDTIRSAITTAITNFEKRVSEFTVDVVVNNDEDSYTATITFLTQNIERPVTVNVLLERVR